MALGGRIHLAADCEMKDFLPFGNLMRSGSMLGHGAIREESLFFGFNCGGL